MNLRNKIGLFLILISIVAVFATGLLILQNAAADKKNYITELNSVLGPQISNSLDQKGKSLVISLNALSGLTPAAAPAAIKQFKLHNDGVSFLFIKTKEGNLMSFALDESALSTEALNLLTENLADLKNTRLEKGKLTSHETGLFLTPFSSESFAAVLLGEKFFKDSFELARGKPAALISRKNILFHAGLGENLSELFKKTPADVWDRTEIISFELKDSDQREHLVNFSKNTTLENSYVVLLAPQATWKDLTAPILKSSLWLVVLLIALSMLIAWLISRSLAKPIEELTDLTSHVGKGDWKKIEIQSKGYEIRRLTRAFNRMIENLKTREHELKLAQNKIVQAESLAAVGRMGAGIAHEVKNPLSSILGYGQLIEIKIAGNKEPAGTPQTLEKIKEYVKLLLDDTRRANKIISELLTFTRQKPVNAEKQNLLSLLEGFVPKLQSLCDADGVRFKVELQPVDSAVVAVDAEQLYQVIFNLVQNALHALKPTESSDRQIDFSARTSAGFAEIAVTDNGPGISDENIKKIFEPFFSTKKVGEGTGLGLAICYGIIQQHQGTIEVVSHPGKHTSFTIRLPLVD